MTFASSAVPTAPTVIDKRSRSRFELSVNGETAFLEYKRHDGVLTLLHTEVPEALRGRHVGESLVAAALRTALAGRLRVIAACPFVAAYMRRHSADR